MKNLNISEETREKYEDAVVAVFMEQYAAALQAGIQQELDECKDDEFPPELEKRCLDLINKEYAKKKRKAFSKQFLRVCRSAAVIAIVLLSVCSVLFMTVDAFRIPVMNFFIERADRYMQLSGNVPSNTLPDGFNEENPLEGIIPENFVLVFTDGTWESGYIITDYANESGATFHFVINPSSGNLQIDPEGSKITRTKLLGHDAWISVEGTLVQITWLDESVAKIFALSSTNVSEDMVLIYAEEIAARFD